jgi:hypothetical protein
MAATSKKGESVETIEIMEVQQGQFECYILGKTPLIFNCMSEKAARELLMPRKKTAADKAANLKHNPLVEYRASADTAKDPKAPTRLLLTSTAFKGAMRSVAIDIPGAAKAQIGRLTYVENEYVSIYGIPKLFMSITRSADMNKTPDVRTRAIVPAWACKITVTYTVPLLREKDVANLLAAAGIMRGVGDWRVEKGSGNYGQFTLVNKADPTWAEIVKTGGRVAQDAALETPEPYDAKTAELLGWFVEEADRRGFKAAA